MASIALSTGTQTIAQRTAAQFGPGGEDVVASVVFQIVNAAGGFSTIPRIRAEEATSAPVNVQYFNVQTGATIAGGTTITADGIYAVYAPGCQVALVTSAGTATAIVSPRILGRVF